MAEDQAPKDNEAASEGEHESLLANLKGAGSSLGGLVGEFVGAYRKDREATPDDSGTHALHDPVDEKDTTVAQIRAAGQDARRTYQEGSGFGAVKGAAGTFAGHAEGIVRDVAGSVVAAAGAAKDSGKVDEIGGALGRVRDNVEDAFDKVRDRLHKDEAHPVGSAEGDSTVIIDGEVISAETTEAPIDKKDR